MKYITAFRIVLLCILFQSRVISQNLTNPDSVLYELDPITVSALRFPEVSSQLPFSVSLISRPAIQQARQQLSLREAVGSVPGLFSLNTYNFAQDLRLSIRGFGARGAFGIRGIKILIDGIPVTTPDGQTSIDNLDLNLIDHLEIIRGPVSTLYGNASGGVINLSSKDQSRQAFLHARLSAGAFGFRQWQIQTGQHPGNLHYRLSASHAELSGYRQHSAMQSSLLDGLLDIRPDSSSALTLHLNFEDSPLADDPGSLTRDQAISDPKQSAPANLNYDAGEKVRQGRVALSYRGLFPGDRELRLTIAYTDRKFTNRLPFSEGGLVNLTRHCIHVAGIYEQVHPFLGFTGHGQIGLEAAFQNDHRKRFKNLEGTEGDLLFNQKEIYRSTGFFFQEQLDLTAGWQLLAGVRYDLSDAQAKDYFSEPPIQDGIRTFSGFSGLIGLSWQITPAAGLFGNLSTGFETPALIELTNNPKGTAGFNPDLQAQHLLNSEAGLKGRLFSRWQYELSVFQIVVDDELVPYELPAQPDRTFYHNAGRSIHRGLETALQGSVFPGISCTLSYTFSDFYYSSFPVEGKVYDGNTIPGIPDNHFYGEIFYTHQSGLYSRIEMQGTGKIYTNDANSDTQRAYWLLNIQAGWRRQFTNWLLEPFIGLNNLLDTNYSDNIRINAFGGRYFEPAPPFNLFAGFSLKYIFQKVD